MILGAGTIWVQNGGGELAKKVWGDEKGDPSLYWLVYYLSCFN